MKSYEFRHRVGLEETNMVGNVYYSHYVRWQGRCREMFLHEHVPELVRELGNTFSMVTTHVSCSYYRELSAFDEILIRMSVGSMSPSRLRMLFRYFLVLSGDEELPVAEGEQEVVCVQRVGSTLEPVLLPVPLREALQRYVDSTPVGVEVTMARY